MVSLKGIVKGKQQKKEEKGFNADSDSSNADAEIDQEWQRGMQTRDTAALEMVQHGSHPGSNEKEKEFGMNSENSIGSSSDSMAEVKFKSTDVATTSSLQPIKAIDSKILESGIFEITQPAGNGTHDHQMKFESVINVPVQSKEEDEMCSTSLLGETELEPDRVQPKEERITHIGASMNSNNTIHSIQMKTMHSNFLSGVFLPEGDESYTCASGPSNVTLTLHQNSHHDTKNQSVQTDEVVIISMDSHHQSLYVQQHKSSDLIKLEEYLVCTIIHISMYYITLVHYFTGMGVSS
eukprot:c27219_g2_i1 orf=434-1315(+)